MHSLCNFRQILSWFLNNTTLGFFFWVGMNFSFVMCVLLRSVPTGNRIDKLISNILVTSHEVIAQLKQCYEQTALNRNETLVTWCDVWKDAMEATQFRVWGIPRVYFLCILWAVKFHLDIGLHRVSTKTIAYNLLAQWELVFNKNIAEITQCMPSQTAAKCNNRTQISEIEDRWHPYTRFFFP